MGLRRITGQQFHISPEEWQKREMRKHSAWRWFVTICQIAGIVAFVLVSMWLIDWLGVI